MYVHVFDKKYSRSLVKSTLGGCEFGVPFAVLSILKNLFLSLRTRTYGILQGNKFFKYFIQI